MNKETRWLLEEKYHGHETSEFQADILRLEHGEPLAYVIGWVDFLGCRIDLSSRPLIPRPETEFWVESVIGTIAKKNNAFKILDLFSGSGCIGIALAKHLPNVSVDFGEKDPKCCEQVAKNITANNIAVKNVSPLDSRRRADGAFGGLNSAFFAGEVSAADTDFVPSPRQSLRGMSTPVNRTRVIQTDVFSHITDTYDYIVANPPYIDPAKKATVEESVLRNEPHEALFAEEGGLTFIKQLLAEAAAHLHPGGLLVIEFGEDQKEDITQLAKDTAWNIEFEKDQFGKWRIAKLSTK